MSYDYSSASKTLELPNPYRTQNRLLFASAGVFCLAGLWSLWHSRQSLRAAAILVGLALLFAGLIAAGTAAKRLRFFFGRGRPISLAPELPPEATGTSPRVGDIKKILRDGALTYPEPVGAVDGILYHLIPRLITAPAAIQAQAKVAFFNLAALLVATASFAFAWGAFGTEATRPWLALAYFAFGAVFLMRPILGSGTAKLTPASLIVLIAAAVLGPSLIAAFGASLPALKWSLAVQTALMLTSACLAVTLILLATLAQVQASPETRSSAEQVTLALNVPPSLLTDELERHMQEQWVERIPNRRYSKAVPVIDPSRHAGPFSGELLEETQPVPLQGTVPATLREALASDRHRWLSVLDLFATVLMLAGVACALAFALLAGSPEPGQLPMSFGSAAMISVVLATFCFKSASRLWGRFDFESVLVWVELTGTYQTASLGTGNALSTRLQTSNQIVRSESMTVRVWRARVESVVFDKDGARQVTAMFSTENEAKELVRHLVEFGSSRAALVAPGSPADMQHIQALGNAERLLQGAASGQGPTSLSAIQAQEGALLGGTAPVADLSRQAARFCAACGHQVQATANFCVDCGARMGG